jgi:capsular exopolysaccharide synthesis family protein
MELKQLLAILRKRWRIAALTWLVIMFLGAAAAFLPAEHFTASTTLLAQPDPTKAEFGQIQIVEFVMPAVQRKVEGDETRKAVLPDLPRAVARAPFTVAFSNEAGTGVFEVTIDSTDQAAVAPIANAYSDYLVRRQPIPDLLEVSALDRADAPTAPASPPKKVLLVASFVLGLIAATVAALTANALRRTIGTADEMRRRFGVPVLGEIPPLNRRFKDATAEDLLTQTDDRAAQEAFHRIRSNIEIALLTDPKAIAITSVAPAEGKSTVSAVLAWSLAMTGNRVVLVDSDLRRPSAHRRLGEPFGSGVAGYRPGEELPWQSTRLPKLRFVPAGIPKEHPSDTVTVALAPLIAGLNDQGSLVLLDAPPLTGAAETFLIAAVAGSAVLVVDGRRYDEAALEKAIHELQGSRVNVLGIVINQAKLSRRARRIYDDYGAPMRLEEPTARPTEDRGDDVPPVPELPREVLEPPR